ncbi:uncharacterized protein [Paramormyrops kingsleyae]|uniref:uncharacterized protein isoform X13 n=1 Tax=Paramormyrops kingsleyae TaxID=1676925 RepID=UPI003B9769A8
MVPLLFLLHVFFIRLPGGDSVWSFGYLTAQTGESLTIPCFYDQKYKDHVKYWCRGQLWNSCTIMTRTDSPQSSSKVSITDNPAQLVFHVTMRNLEKSDADIYWCAVEIDGQKDDCKSLSIEVKGAWSVRTVSWVSAERGGSVTIPCYYDQKYKHHVKYWCRGRDWNSCSSLARSDSNQPAGKVSISDDPAHLVFNVAMKNLQEKDSDTYWCAVEIHGAADDGVYLQLIVMEGWAGTTYPSGSLTSTTNDNLSTTQSPSQMLLLLTLVMILLLVTTVMVIWILRRRTNVNEAQLYHHVSAETLISNRNRPSRPQNTEPGDEVIYSTMVSKKPSAQSQTTETGDEVTYSTMVTKKPSAQSPSVDSKDEVTYSSVTLQDNQKCPPSDVTYSAVVPKKNQIS